MCYRQPRGIGQLSLDCGRGIVGTSSREPRQTALTRLRNRRNEVDRRTPLSATAIVVKFR